MHPLLEKQLEKTLAELKQRPLQLEDLLARVSKTYVQSDLDRDLLERTLELTSQELATANDELRSRQATLEREVDSRTAELIDTNTELRVEVAERAAIERELREGDLRYRALA